MSGKSTVSVVRCPDYDFNRVEDAVACALGLLPGFSKSIKNTGVVVKIDLARLPARQPHMFTDPAMVHALAKVLKEKGARVTVVEGGDILGWRMWRRARKIFLYELKHKVNARTFEHANAVYNALMGAKTLSDLFKVDVPGVDQPIFQMADLGMETEFDVFKNSNILEAAVTAGADLSFIEIEEFKDCNSQTARFVSKVPVCRSVCDANRVISLPKARPIPRMALAGAITNLFSIAPTAQREVYEKASGIAGMRGELLVDVFSCIQPAPFVISDCIAGPWHDNVPRVEGVIMASCDCVAHDAVLAHRAGLDPMSLPVISVAHEAGLGQGIVKEIQILGDA